MKNNVIIIIISIILYTLTFRLASKIFELYIVHLNGSVISFLFLEQSIIPFVFGYFIYKIISLNSKCTFYILVIVPVVSISIAILEALIEGSEGSMFESPYLFTFVIVFQVLFVTLGAYVQYKIKVKR